MEKKCNKCQEIKSINDFNKKSDTKDGYRNQCKICQKKSRNRDKEKLYDKSYKEKNRQKINEYMKKYRKKKYVYKEKNKKTIEEIREYNRVYLKNKRDLDPNYKLRKNIQRNITRSFKRININKNSKTQTMLGCSFKEFKIYLESKFESWMSWENYGLYNGRPNYGWDIDHLIPSHTAKDEKDIFLLNHFTNLQPLCSYKNRVVKNKKTN